MCENVDRLAEVRGLAVCTSSILKHAHDEAKLAKETMFSRTTGGDMGLGEAANRMNVVHDLQQWVGVGVQNVRFKAAEFSLVIEAMSNMRISSMKDEGSSDQRPHPKSKSSTPNFEYSISTFAYFLGTSSPTTSLTDESSSTFQQG